MVPTPIRPSVRPCRSHGNRAPTKSFCDQLRLLLVLDHERDLLGERQR